MVVLPPDHTPTEYYKYNHNYDYNYDRKFEYIAAPAICVLLIAIGGWGMHREVIALHERRLL